MVGIKIDDSQKFWSLWRHRGPKLGSIWVLPSISEIFGTFHGKYTKISNYMSFVTLKTMVDIIINDTQKFCSLYRHHGPRFGLIWVNFLSSALFMANSWNLELRGILAFENQWWAWKLMTFKSFGHYDVIVDQNLGQFG